MNLHIIHITDIHLHSEEDYKVISSRIEPLVNAVFSHITKPESDFIAICLTGDLADTGNAEEYAYFSQFLHGLFEAIHKKSREARVLMVSVPGNHDCDFGCEGNIVRSELLRGKGLNLLEPEIITTATSIQKGYWNFAAEWQKEDYCYFCKSNSIFTENIFSIEDQGLNIVFHCINSAWCSQLHEKQGEIRFDWPKNINKSDSDIVITLMHHDDSWLDWESKENWKTYYQNYSDIILLGHDHTQEYVHKENYDDNSSYFIKGNQFYSSKNPEISGFNVLKIDVENGLQYFASYSWDENAYKNIMPEPYKAKIFQRNRFQDKGIRVNQGTKQYLEELSIDVTSKERDKINLSDVFVYPRLKAASLGNKKRQVFFREKDKVLNYIKTKKYIQIEGNKEFGKTALLKILFKDFLADGLYPILMDITEINSADDEVLYNIIGEKYEQEYDNLTCEQALQLEPSKKACLIDDFDMVSLSDKSRKKLLEFLKQKFGIVVITGNSRNALLDFVQNLELSDYISENFEKMTIMNIGSSVRRQIIDKWLLLTDPRQDINSMQFDGQRHKKMEQIDLVMRKGFFNKTPIELLLVLSYLDNVGNINRDYSRYSYVYEGIIIDKINRISNNETNEAAMFMTILQQIAFEMFEDGTNKNIEESRVLELIGDYNQEYAGTRGKIITIVNQLVEQGFLINIKSAYRFKYNYMFYYFIGKNIKEQLSPAEQSKAIDKVFSDLSNETNFNVALFLAYSSNIEYELVPRVVSVCKTLLPQNENFKYTDQQVILDDLSLEVEKKLDKIFVPTNDIIPMIQKKNEELFDEIDDKISDDDEKKAINEMSNDYTKLFRIIELLGNIIQNYSSKIKKAPRMEMIDLMNSSTLKMIGFLCELIRKEIEKISSIISEKDSDSEKTITTKTEVIQKMHEYLGMLWTLFIEVSIYNMAYNLQSDRIIDDINKYVEDDGTEISKLVELNILLLISNNRLPVKKIVRYYKGKDKLTFFSRCIMRNMVASFLTSYQYDMRDKQEICSALDLDIKQTYVPRNDE